MKILFVIPSMESAELFHITGHLIGSIERLDSTWPDGVIGRPAPDSQPWLQPATTTAIEQLRRRRLRLQNEDIYKELEYDQKFSSANGFKE
jgi:hypothetical protein